MVGRFFPLIAAAALGIPTLARAEGQVSSFAVPTASTVLSTDVLGPGQYTSGYTNGSTVDLIFNIPQADTAPYNIAYNQAGDMIDFSPWVVSGAFAGTFGSDVHGRPTVGSGNLHYQGEPDVPGIGFGAHANWFITFDLDEVRSAQLAAGGPGDEFQLTGRYGLYGDASAIGEVQGAIFVDGVRIDSLSQNTGSGTGLTSPEDFEYTFGPNSQYLTIALLNGNDSLGNSTVWDDQVFQNLVLSTQALPLTPEPSSVVLFGVLMVAAAGWYRRRRDS